MAVRAEEICVVGGGPGGISAALKLNQLGSEVCVIDKSTFPRDKICGDAVSTFAVACLKELDPVFFESLQLEKENYRFKGVRIYGPAGKKMQVDFSSRKGAVNARFGFTSKRFDLDNSLFQYAKSKPGISTVEGVKINEITRHNGGLLLHSSQLSQPISARLVIIADGSAAHTAKNLMPQNGSDNKEALALRQYYSNIFFEDCFLEFYFIKDVLPGYVWVFPLPGGMANVGIFLQKKYIKTNSLNLRQLFEEIIASNKGLRARLAGATALTEMHCFNLQTGPVNTSISGDNFVLVGDTAHLADPFTGEGIGNAIFSGIKAAEVINECCINNDYSAKFLAKYDKLVKGKLNRKMKINGGLIRLFAHSLVPETIEQLCQTSLFCSIARQTDIIREKLKI